MGRNIRMHVRVNARGVKKNTEEGKKRQSKLGKEVQQRRLSLEQVEGGDGTDTHGLTRIGR